MLLLHLNPIFFFPPFLYFCGYSVLKSIPDFFSFHLFHLWLYHPAIPLLQFCCWQFSLALSWGLFVTVTFLVSNLAVLMRVYLGGTPFVRHKSKHFTCINLLKSYNSPVKYVYYLLWFYRWGIWNIESWYMMDYFWEVHHLLHKEFTINKIEVVEFLRHEYLNIFQHFPCCIVELI